MRIQSAGVVLYRRRGTIEVFLIHPGGPYWRNKDAGAWSIPKGVVSPQEDALAAAKREFQEETGFAPSGAFKPLGTFRQPSGKDLTAYAVEGNCDPAKLVSNTFEIIWPPKSGRLQSFPEADRGAWFETRESLVKILKGQRPILEKLFAELA